MPRRAAVLAVGSGGDIGPMAEIAGRLAGRGLEVTLLAPSRYEGMADAAGVAFQSIGADETFTAVFDDPAVWAPRTGLAASWRYYGAALRSGFATIRAGWSSRDTVLVSSSFAVAARLAEESLGFQNTTVHLSPAVIFSGSRPPRWPAGSLPPGWPPWLTRPVVRAVERLVVDPVIGAHVNPFRRELGLGDERRLFSRWLHSPRQVAYAFPAWLAPAADDWPRQGIFAGFPRRHGPPRALPAAVSRFLESGGGPVVVVTAGTAVARRPAWVSRVVRWAAGAGWRVVLVEPESAGDVPVESICRVPYAPFESLLPSSQLIVHHGGIGTLAEGLRAGVPQLIAPSAHDQPDNAARIQALGAGRVLAPEPDPGTLAAAFFWALDTTAWRPAVECLRSQLESAADGADVIAAMVTGDSASGALPPGR